MAAATNPTLQFVRELRSLLRSPYTLIGLETFEEDRALTLLARLAEVDGRSIHEWSATTGFDGKGHGGDLRAALGQVERTGGDGIFVFKDVAPLLHDDPGARRQLRELEASASVFGKTLIFLGPQRLQLPELDKDLTTLVMPLPDRHAVRQELEHILGDGAAALSPEERQRLVSGAMGLTLREARRAFHRVHLQWAEARQRNSPFDLEGAILREKGRLIGRSDTLEFHPLAEGLGDVGGLDQLKAWLGERARAFSEEARDFGLPAPRGVLLIGVQGCGKSLTAKVIGRFWGLPLLRLDLGSVFDGRRAPEESLREALRTSEAIAPCVLWLDEIEKGFGPDDEGRASRVLASLLTWLQEKSAPVFLVATANQVEALPPELLRKGRFDEIFFVDLPEVHERAQILRIHLTRRGRVFDAATVEALAERCEHFSGAELEQVVVSAMYSAFAANRDLEPEDLLDAAKRTVPLFRTYEEQIKALRQWAEGRARPASTRRRVLDYFGGR